MCHQASVCQKFNVVLNDGPWWKYRDVWRKCVCLYPVGFNVNRYNGVIMSSMSSQITSLTIVYSTVYLRADQRKHQNSASLAFVRGIHRGPVNFPHKGPVTRRMFPFDDVMMCVYENKHPWHPISSKWLSAGNSHLEQDQGEYLWSALKYEQVCWTTETVFYIHATFVYKNCLRVCLLR